MNTNRSSEKYLFLKAVPWYPGAPPRRTDVVAYLDTAATREYFRFIIHRPRFGCRRVKIPIGTCGTMVENRLCKWLPREALSINEATHRYVTHIHWGSGYFGDGMRYIVAPDNKSADQFARRAGVTPPVHMQYRTVGGHWALADNTIETHR